MTRVIVYMFFPLLVVLYLAAQACSYVFSTVLEVHGIVEERLE